MKEEDKKEMGGILEAARDLRNESTEDLIEVRSLIKQVLVYVENEMDRRGLI